MKFVNTICMWYVYIVRSLKLYYILYIYIGLHLKIKSDEEHLARNVTFIKCFWEQLFCLICLKQ